MSKYSRRSSDPRPSGRVSFTPKAAVVPPETALEEGCFYFVFNALQQHIPSFCGFRSVGLYLLLDGLHDAPHGNVEIVRAALRYGPLNQTTQTRRVIHLFDSVIPVTTTFSVALPRDYSRFRSAEREDWKADERTL